MRQCGMTAAERVERTAMNYEQYDAEGGKSDITTLFLLPAFRNNRVRPIRLHLCSTNHGFFCCLLPVDFIVAIKAISAFVSSHVFHHCFSLGFCLFFQNLVDVAIKFGRQHLLAEGSLFWRSICLSVDGHK